MTMWSTKASAAPRPAHGQPAVGQQIQRAGGRLPFRPRFQLMVEPGNLRVLDILANASADIAEGEVLQLTAAQDLATSEEIYLKVVRGKTAALFSAATESAA
jgi:geranylgeranyl pyrophosphate synthase